jgi:membrane associated rhomboid family serine protease
MLIPIRTDRPRIRPAYVTVTLIVICVLVQLCGLFLPSVQVMSDGAPIEAPLLVVRYGLWGSHPTLIALVAHMFIHGGILHLAGNMLFLWIFGSLIEDVLRPAWFLALYLGGGLMAALAHISISALLGRNLDVPMVGASGAIAAVMGLFMLRFHKTRVQIFYLLWFRGGAFWIRSIWALAIWIGLEVISGMIDAAATRGGGGVAHWAHVGGFVVGAVAAPFIGGVEQANREYVTDDPHTNVEYVRRGEHVAAVEKALRADPHNADLMLELAHACRRAGDTSRATDAYLRCLSDFGGRRLIERAAAVYLELHAFNDAAAVPAEVLLPVAEHLETEHPDMAVAAYRSLVRRHVTRPEAESALLRLSVLYRDTLRQPFEALACLNEFLQRYPSSQRAGEAQQARQELDAELRLR